MKVKVLIEGYAKDINGEEYASCSTVLIDDRSHKIIVDPGANRELLLNKLSEENLSVDDIDIVILTHTHLDHSLLTGMFKNAIVYDNSSLYYMDGKEGEHAGKIGEDIEIISTPGHDQFHASILVKNTDKGNIVISGDVFWWYDGEEQNVSKEKLLEREDPFVKNIEELVNSRKALLAIANYIIPGHGKPFFIK